MLDTILSEYAAYLQAEKGMAEATRRGYLAAVNSLLEVARAFPRRLHLPADWGLEHLDKRALEIYLNHLHEERGRALSTVALQAGALRAFFGFLQRRGYVGPHPAPPPPPHRPRAPDRA